MVIITYLIWSQLILIPILGMILLGMKRENENKRRLLIMALRRKR